MLMAAYPSRVQAVVVMDLVDNKRNVGSRSGHLHVSPVVGSQGHFTDQYNRFTCNFFFNERLVLTINFSDEGPSINHVRLERGGGGLEKNTKGGSQGGGREVRGEF